MQILKLSRNSMYRLRKKGLPYKKVLNRLIRYDLDEVMKWIDENTEQK